MSRAVDPAKVGDLRPAPCEPYTHHRMVALPLQVEYTTPVRRSLDREVTHWYRVYASIDGPCIVVRGGRLVLDTATAERIEACVA